jgi:hypothetical protein
MLKQIITSSKPDLPRSNKNKNSDSPIIPDKNQQCQGFSNKRIENVRLSIVADGYGDFVDEIIGDILAAGGQDA